MHVSYACMLRLRVRGSNSLQVMRLWTRGPALRCLRGRSAYVPLRFRPIALVGFPADDVDRARRFRQRRRLLTGSTSGNESDVDMTCWTRPRAPLRSVQLARVWEYRMQATSTAHSAMRTEFRRSNIDGSLGKSRPCQLHEFALIVSRRRPLLPFALQLRRRLST